MMFDDLKPYSEMAGSALQWAPLLPAHWGVRALKHAAEAVIGGATPKSDVREFWNGDVPWATPKDVSRTARLRNTERTLTEEGLNSISAILVPTGSVILTSRAPVGNTAIADIELATNQGCKAILPRPGVSDGEFLNYVFAIARPWIEATATGTTFIEVSTADVAAIQVPVPPLEEQRVIVTYLTHAHQRINETIAAKRQLLALLKQVPKVTAHDLVTGGLSTEGRTTSTGSRWFPRLPSGWTSVPLGRVIDRAVDGPHFSPTYVDEGVPFVSARNVRPGRLVLDSAKFVSDSDAAEFDKRIRPELGDVLFTKGGTTGVACAVESDLRFQVWVHIAVLKVRKDLVDPRYLAIALNSPPCYEQSQLETRGATNKDLGLERMKRIMLPLPPLSAQQEIIEHYTSETSRVEQHLELTRREIALLEEFRTRLTSDVVTGQIDVRHIATSLPSVDPAEAFSGAPDTVGDEADGAAASELDDAAMEVA